MMREGEGNGKEGGRDIHTHTQIERERGGEGMFSEFQINYMLL